MRRLYIVERIELCFTSPLVLMYESLYVLCVYLRFPSKLFCLAAAVIHSTSFPVSLPFGGGEKHSTYQHSHENAPSDHSVFRPSFVDCSLIIAISRGCPDTADPDSA